jgi:hypothetical protein
VRGCGSCLWSGRGRACFLGPRSGGGARRTHGRHGGLVPWRSRLVAGGETWRFGECTRASYRRRRGLSRPERIDVAALVSLPQSRVRFWRGGLGRGARGRRAAGACWGQRDGAGGRAVVVLFQRVAHNWAGTSERAERTIVESTAKRMAGKTRDDACAVVARSTESPGRWGGDLLPLASSRHPRMAALPEL